MILKKITIQNIASIEHAEVDFAALPLREADLFLIHGETGAGKSTLIDAICLALYKNTPRLKSAPKDKLKFGNYELSSQDSANMLRHGATDGKAELDFVGNDQQSYTAVWSAHRTPKNIVVKHYLMKDSIQIADGKVVVDLIQTSILGMTFDDFCRTAVLAQGEFTRFLKSDDKEKSAILEKLTGTEYFSEVGRTIFAIWKEKDEAFNALSAEVQGIRLLSAEEIQAIEQAIAEAKANESTLDSEISRLTGYKNWLETDSKLDTAQGQLQKEYEKALADCSTPEYQEESKLLAQWDLSQQAITCYKDKQTQQAQEQKNQRIERDLELRFAKVSSGLAFVRQQVADYQISHQQISKVLEEQKPHVDMYEKVVAVKTVLNTASDQIVQMNQTTASLNLLVAKEPNCIELLRKASENKAIILAEKQKVEKEISLQSQQIQQLNPDLVSQESKRISLQQSALLNASISLKELGLAIEAEEKNSLALSKAEKQYEADLLLEKQLFDSMNSAKQSFEVADRVLHTINMAASDWAVKARAVLKDGEKCPVCGNLYNASHFDEVIESVKEAEQARYNDAKSKLDDAVNAYNRLKSGLELLKKSIDSMRDDSKVLSQKRKAAFLKAKEVCAQLGIDVMDDSRQSLESAIGEGKRLKDQNEKAAQENAKRTEELNAQNQLLAQLNGQLQKQNELHTKALGVEAKAQQDLQKCQSDIKSANELIQQFEKQIADHLAQADGMITWPNWKADWERDAHAFVSRMTEESNEYKARTVQLSEISNRLENLRSELKVYDAQYQSVAALFPSWKTSPADEKNAGNLSQRLNAITTEVAALCQSKVQVQTAIAADSQWLDDFFARHEDINEERLRLLADFDAVGVRARHQQLDQEKSSKLGQLENGRRQLQEHRQNQPWGLENDKDVAQYSIQIAALNEQKSACSQVVGAKKKELEDNETHVREQGEKLLKLQQQEVILSQWAAFTTLYGDLTGSKFRRLAQQLVFDRLLQLANQQLARLTGRYTLETIPGTLSISLRDQFASDFCSPVYNLSGGESFMVSLSLALALSNMGREGISMDTLFIDEGFGTLSADNQAKVMDLLQTLQHEQGKRVGIISHVPFLLERIPTQIKVERIDGTRSRLSITDATR